MLWLIEPDGLTGPQSTSQAFTEHYRQADLSMLSLRVVTARVYVTEGGHCQVPITEGGHCHGACHCQGACH